MHTTQYTHTDRNTGKQQKFWFLHHGDFSEVKVRREVDGEMYEVDLDPALIQAVMALGAQKAAMDVITFCEDLPYDGVE